MTDSGSGVADSDAGAAPFPYPHISDDPAHPERTHTMGREDTELVSFAARWAPFGGPPAEEVFVRFGITLPRFRIRVQEAAARIRSERLSRAAGVPSA